MVSFCERRWEEGNEFEKTCLIFLVFLLKNTKNIYVREYKNLLYILVNTCIHTNRIYNTEYIFTHTQYSYIFTNYLNIYKYIF